MSAPILSVSHLCKEYGELRAVDGLSFTVGPHEILGLLGPNGAGKTTTINMILGVLEPTSGSITIDGCDLAPDAGARRWAAPTSPRSTPPCLATSPSRKTCASSACCMLCRICASASKPSWLILTFCIFATRKCGVLSSGEQTRVALAKAMLNQPRLLLLDEPTASLDPSIAREIRATIRAFADGIGVGVLWTSHNMIEVAEVCHRVLFLSHGKILLEGDPRTLPADNGHQTLEDLFVAVAREPLTIRNLQEEA